MHYFIIVTIIVGIVIWQISIFVKTKNKLTNFKSIFSDNSRNYKLLSEKEIEKIENASDEQLDKMLEEAGFDIQKYHYNRGEFSYFRRESAKNDLKAKNNNVPGFSSQNDNPVYKEIETSINNYLSVNKSGVSDFHLMKDIVDRNCDAQEEEINTQIPIPLYLGLVGTMIGILVGIGYLWISGGLGVLLGSSNTGGTDGVEALLGGVALAMISSILGILLTTFGSMKAKNAKAKVEKNKHIFLSWIQAKLLPNLSNDTAQTLEKMSQNLVKFNETFSNNTSNLGVALAKVNESYKLQTDLITAVNKIQEGRTAAANLQLLSKLMECSAQIGTLGEYLRNSNDYLSNVKSLNEKLDASEQRTKTIEGMAAFFKKEILQIETREGLINKAVGSVDSILEEKLRQLAENANENIKQFYKALGEQQDALQKKLNETSIIVGELKNLSAIKESISKFERATNDQNKKIDNLATAIQSLAKAKTQTKTEGAIMEIPMPVKKKILIWTSSAVGGLLLLFLIIANWKHIAKIIDLFEM